MKRPVYITLFLLGLWLLSLVLSACASLEQAPAQATAIAETVVAGASTVQAAGETILTPIVPMTPTPEGVFNLTNVCIPPLNMKELTEVTLTDGRRVTAVNGFITVYKANGTMESAQQAPAEVDTPFADLDVVIETFRCETTNIVYYNPDSVK